MEQWQKAWNTSSFFQILVVSNCFFLIRGSILLDTTFKSNKQQVKEKKKKINI